MLIYFYAGNNKSCKDLNAYFQASMLNLVEYSDSDEDFNDNATCTNDIKQQQDSHNSANQKRKASDRDILQDKLDAKTLNKKPKQISLPLPSSIKELFSDKEIKRKDDPDLHDGRLRSFAHEEGSWATHVHIPYEEDDGFDDLVEQLLLCLRPLDFKVMDSFHISLSRTVSIRHHWISSLTSTLKNKLQSFNQCFCELTSVKLYTNDEKTRTFLALEVISRSDILHEFTDSVDTCFEEYKLPQYYQPPSFHISIAWCLGDVLKQVTKNQLQQLKDIFTTHIDQNQGLNIVPVNEILCKTGNKNCVIPLQTIGSQMQL